jgi:hypothetical protein
MAGGPRGSRIDVWFALLRCRRCNNGVMGRLEVYHGDVGAGPHNIEGDPTEHKWRLREWFPSEPISETCPEHVPEKVSAYFNEARDCLTGENWNAAGAMYRKAIDVATKDLVRNNWAEADIEKTIKEDLIVRIERLHARGLLTEALKDWAHQVRIGGKDAAHDEDPFTQPEAEALHQFTRLFLTYTYTMPEEVRLRRPEKPATENKEAASSTATERP